jgi:hypothetical protein
MTKITQNIDMLTWGRFVLYGTMQALLENFQRSTDDE